MMPPWPGIVLAKSYRREEVKVVETEVVEKNDDIQQVMVTLQPENQNIYSEENPR